jgi:hypothetical protein
MQSSVTRWGRFRLLSVFRLSNEVSVDRICWLITSAKCFAYLIGAGWFGLPRGKGTLYAYIQHSA